MVMQNLTEQIIEFAAPLPEGTPVAAKSLLHLGKPGASLPTARDHLHQDRASPRRISVGSVTVSRSPTRFFGCDKFR